MVIYSTKHRLGELVATDAKNGVVRRVSAHYTIFTPAAWMTPNRETNAVANATAKPSRVCVTRCETTKYARIAQERGFYTLGTAMTALGVLATDTPSAYAVARDIGKQGKYEKRVVFGAALWITWDSAHGNGACETVSGEGRDLATVVLSTERVGGRESRRARMTKPWKAQGATLARSPFYISVS